MIVRCEMDARRPFLLGIIRLDLMTARRAGRVAVAIDPSSRILGRSGFSANRVGSSRDFRVFGTPARRDGRLMEADLLRAQRGADNNGDACNLPLIT